MRCSRCGTCCQETDMLLSTKDIKRLEKKGYRRDFFVRSNEEGYLLLRNRQGCCVFYSAKDQCCNVYADRPAGCRVYPVIYDEEKGVIIDNICQAQTSITEEEKTVRGRKVRRLLDLIDNEVKTRTQKQ